MTTLIADAGLLIGMERARPTAVRLAGKILDDDGRIVLPASVLSQVWRSGRQARLAMAIRTMHVVALDEPTAREIGALLGVTRTSDVVDAHVAVLSARHGALVATTDPDDMRALGVLPHRILRL